ncbi:hypothetical protein H4219_004745, partial [Mycoemilia scoparia]
NLIMQLGNFIALTALAASLVAAQPTANFKRVLAQGNSAGVMSNEQRALAALAALSGSHDAVAQAFGPSEIIGGIRDYVDCKVFNNCPTDGILGEIAKFIL